MIYTVYFYNAEGQEIGEATFNVPSDAEFIDCALVAIRSAWQPGTESIRFVATPV
jgi:hypothetical protein